VLLLASSNVFSQNIQTATIEWHCNSIFTAKPGIFVEEMSRVVSSAGQITWYDKDGVVKETFSITGSDGSWTNVSSSGSMQFIVSSGEDRGSVQFSSSGSATTIRILTITQAEPQIYELTVTTINTL
jgi:hypothetical protein